MDAKELHGLELLNLIFPAGTAKSLSWIAASVDKGIPQGTPLNATHWLFIRVDIRL